MSNESSLHVWRGDGVDVRVLASAEAGDPLGPDVSMTADSLVDFVSGDVGKRRANNTLSISLSLFGSMIRYRECNDYEACKSNATI